MIPTFSIEWNASSRFSSCWKIAYMTPITADSAADARTTTPNHVGQLAEPLDEHPDEAVDRHLDHHAAHQCRDVGRGDRVRAGEPACAAARARLCPHADERGDGDRDLRARARRDRLRPPKAPASARSSTAIQVPAPTRCVTAM